MKRDIKIYNYFASCPLCKGVNTRLNKALDNKYALCYSCGGVFKLSNDEIEKFLTPAPLKTALISDLDYLTNQESSYIDTINNISSQKKNNDLEKLNAEKRNFTLEILNNITKKNFVILTLSTAEINNNNDNQIFILPETDPKLIEKKLYNSVLKFGKIDYLIIENIENIILGDLLKRLETTFANYFNLITYTPIMDNVYIEYNNYIHEYKYIYCNYTITRSTGCVNLNMIEFKKLKNFYVQTSCNRITNDKNFSEKLFELCEQEAKNIIYSEPRLILYQS